MIFYQHTTDTIIKDMLIDAILKAHSSIKSLYFSFKNYPTVNTLSEALGIIEEKRKTLKNPNHHTFLCLELILNDYTNSHELSEAADKLADTINTYFGNDLFIMTMIYLGETNILHTVLCISDIERSLSESSTFYLNSELISNLFKNSFSDYKLDQQIYHALYSFSGISNPLPYDSIFHVKLCASKNNTHKEKDLANHQV